MKNKLTNLNDHLFAQLERLGDEGLEGEALEKEISRGQAIGSIAKDVISNARLVFDAHKLQQEYGGKKTTPEILGLEHK